MSSDLKSFTVPTVSTCTQSTPSHCLVSSLSLALYDVDVCVVFNRGTPDNWRHFRSQMASIELATPPPRPLKRGS